MVFFFHFNEQADPQHSVNLYVDEAMASFFGRDMAARNQHFGHALFDMCVAKMAAGADDPLARTVVTDRGLGEGARAVLDSSELGLDVVEALSERISGPNPFVDRFRLTIFALGSEASSAAIGVADASVTDSADSVVAAYRSLLVDHLLEAKQVGSFIVEPRGLA